MTVIQHTGRYIYIYICAVDISLKGKKTGLPKTITLQVKRLNLT